MDLKEKGINLNTILVCITLLGSIITGVFFIAPLRTLPGDVSRMKDTQIVQTEAIKTLADVARDSREMRRDFDRFSGELNASSRAHDNELQNIRRRLDRLELK